MKVWQIDWTDKSMEIDVAHSEDFDAITITTAGRQSNDLLNNIEIEVTKKGRHWDFPYLIGGVLVIGNRADMVLSSVLKSHADLLDTRVTNSDTQMKIVNPVNVLDCVDYSLSIPDCNARGTVAGFEKLSFYEHMIKDQIIFKIPEFPETKVYVTEIFRESVINSKLKGIEFKEVWDSERPDSNDEMLLLDYRNFLDEIILNQQGEHINWLEALVRIEAGMTVGNGKWKIRKHSEGKYEVAQLSCVGKFGWNSSSPFRNEFEELTWYLG